MTVKIVQRTGIDDGSTVAIWREDEGFVKSDPELRFAEDPVYEKYTEEMILDEFDGPDRFAVPVDTDEAAEKLAKKALGLFKYRVYVDDPSEVPEGYEVQEGPQGGLFYEEEGGGDMGGGGEGESKPLNTGDYEVDNDYEASVAESVTEGWFGNTHHEDDYVAVRGVQQNISKIESTDLLKDALQQEREGRNSRAMVDAIESRIRALGEEPPGETPEGVPDVRQNTPVDGFDREAAVEAGGFALRHFRRMHDANFEEWNQLLDHMTQEELKETVTKFYEERPELADRMEGSAAATNFHDGSGALLDWEDGPAYGDEVEMRDAYAASTKQLMPILTRMDKETFDQAMSELRGKADVENLAIAGGRWLPDADARREVYREHSEILGGRADIEFQFEEDFSKFQEWFISDWTGMGKAMHHARAAMADEFENEGQDGVTTYVAGKPTAPIEMTPEMKENMETIREESTEAHKEMNEQVQEGLGAADIAAFSAEDERYYKDALNDDGTLTVYRGVTKGITSHGTLESWTTDKETADQFDGASVLEARVDPEDIIMSKYSANANGWRDVGYNDEHEVVLAGGVF